MRKRPRRRLPIGPNKVGTMPKGRSLITELDELGEPVALVKMMELSTHNLGVIHRSYRLNIKIYLVYGLCSYQTLQYLWCMDSVLISMY